MSAGFVFPQQAVPFKACKHSVSALYPQMLQIVICGSMHPAYMHLNATAGTPGGLQGIMPWGCRAPYLEQSATCTNSGGSQSTGSIQDKTCLPCAAQSWGSEESIQRLPVQQQAYMTAALSHSLELLGKQQLEATPGLFPALLSGVSARLDSPEGPIRQEEKFTHCLHEHAAHSLQLCKCRFVIPV